jgi:hypothetical protein
MINSTRIFAPDLRQRPPRSPRCRPGGYVTLPRMLDKGRATVIGRNGEFKYDAPFDQHVCDEETLLFFFRRAGSFSKTREDIQTCVDLIDLDDHMTFDGKA